MVNPMMDGYSLSGLLMLALMLAVILFPIGRILGRIGLSPFWSILAVVPLLGLLGLWALAFMEWPARRETD